MSHRPLALVSALSLGDYFLWNWSLGGNHEVLALISGLTLPPLVIAFLLLSAVTVMRFVTDSAQRSRARTAARARARGTSDSDEPGATARGTWEDEQASARSSSKLAA